MTALSEQRAREYLRRKGHADEGYGDYAAESAGWEAPRWGWDRPSPGGWPAGRTMALWAVLGVLVFLWAQGTFDRALSGVGLNAQPCYQNAFGATYCEGDGTAAPVRPAPTSPLYDWQRPRVR